jgi:hypothetical protein
MTSGLPDLIIKTMLWRKNNAHEDGGVVVVFDGDVQGWCDELRNPEHWQPGCIAVDVDGFCWQTVGGTVYEGAESWQLIN